jgi:hypothetical protein
MQFDVHHRLYNIAKGNPVAIPRCAQDDGEGPPESRLAIRGSPLLLPRIIPRYSAKLSPNVTNQAYE